MDPALPDADLIAHFLRERDDDAFTQLVRRYLDLVYSAALRQVRDVQLAEDVTQGVFIALADKLPALGPQALLGPWLYRATRYACANIQRQRIRQTAREEKAARMATELIAEHGTAQWMALGPALDDAMAELPEADRNALVMRFFEKREVDEIAGRLGIGTSAAEKRIQRALEKLKRSFARRGSMVSILALTALLQAHAIQAAPPALEAAILNGLLKAKGAFYVTPGTLIAKGIIRTMTITKTIKLAVLAAMLLLMGSAGTIAVQHAVGSRFTSAIAQSTSPAVVTEPAASELPASENLPIVPEQVAVTPAPLPAAEEKKPIDLLGLIDPRHDAVAGQWRIENGALLCSATSWGRLELPYEPPGEYDFTIVFARLDGYSEISQTLRKGEIGFRWGMGAWSNSIFAFDQVQGKNSGANATAVKRTACLENGRQYTSVVSVRDTGVAAYLDGQLITRWENYADFSMWYQFELRNKRALGVGSQGGVAAFYKIEVTEVRGKGRVLAGKRANEKSGERQATPETGF